MHWLRVTASSGLNWAKLHLAGVRALRRREVVIFLHRVTFPFFGGLLLLLALYIPRRFPEWRIRVIEFLWANPLFIGTLLLILLYRFLWKEPKRQAASITDAKDRLTAESGFRQTLAQIVGGAALLVGLYFTGQTLHVSQEGQITDRFTKAISQLGEDHKLAVRLGGIYALERIAADSEKDHWPIMEILAAYVREHARWENLINRDWRVVSLPTDVTTALTIISRRRLTRGRLNLRWIDLRGAKLIGIHLEGAILSDAHLEEAHLAQAHLEWAGLNEARLERAILWDTHLEGAMLWGAHLEGAALSGTHFDEAKLLGSHLNNAIFNGVTTLQRADISFADFRGVQGLTVSQIKMALNWRDALYSQELLTELGLPPDHNEKVQKELMSEPGVTRLRGALGEY